MLRSRRSRREEELDAAVASKTIARGEGADPESEAAPADATGVALLVLLDTLRPAERLAFGDRDHPPQRSPAAAKQLASRARRRVRGAPASGDAHRARHREVVEALLAATRTGNLDARLEVLMVFTVENDRITRLDIIGDPDRLRDFTFAVE